jgi:membrane peptidoglycan carboxypeptidase
MLVRKWRLGRVRPNPLGYFIGVAVLLLLVLGVVLASGAGGIYAYSYYSANVGKIQAVADLKLHANSIIYDRYGTKLYTAKGDDQYHMYVPLSQISELVQDATIDTEDHTFYANNGVDLFSTMRAAASDIQAGGAAEGGSTITQQLVKQLVLKNSEKVLTRKLHEAILAYGVNAQYTKAQILEIYLNQIDYGYPNQGIEAAATNYFGLQQIIQPDQAVTTANQQLQLWQAALLVGVPNGPTIFKPTIYSCAKAPCAQDKWDNPFVSGCESPYIHDFYGSATNDPWYLTHGHEWLVYCRTKFVLDHMVHYGDPARGLIYSQAQEDGALAKVREALEQQHIHKGVNTAVNGVTADNRAPHFVRYVEEILADDFGIDHLENAGLTIYTTLDLNLNERLRERLHYYIDEPYADPWYDQCTHCPPLAQTANVHNGAGVALDQYTGDILAMVGSVDYNDASKQVAGQFNAALAKRSMGSATKPIVYATAFQMGWFPGIMQHDDIVCFPNDVTSPDGTKYVTPDAPACKGRYVPHDDEPQYSGTFPIRYMLDNSLNVGATEAMSFVGSYPSSAANYLTMAQRMGITTQQKSAIGPATVLGAQAIPLLQLTGAYATLANQGRRVPPRAVLEIEDARGNIKWQAAARPYSYQAISPQAAYMVTNVLEDNKARRSVFGVTNPLHLDGDYYSLAVAAKTGTSSGNTGPLDLTTLGYSPYMTLGVWLGNDDNEPMLPGITGVKGAGFVFHDVMLWAAERYHWDPDAQFPIPQGVTRALLNCATGLAPYKDAKPDSLACTPMKPTWLQANRWRNLYSNYPGDSEVASRPNADWYWQNAPPLQS